jgi:hypothetical protein
VGRFRYTWADAEAEATRRAKDFVAARPDRGELGHRITYPDSLAPAGRRSKHPMVWVAVFTPVHEGGEVIDGGELLLVVDLESGSVAEGYPRREASG